MQLMIIYSWLYYSFLRFILIYTFYFLYRQAVENKFHCIILTVFSLIGLYTLTSYYHVIFDACNPIFNVLHTGRMLSAASLFILIISFCCFKFKKAPIKLSVSAVLLLAAGISSFCFSMTAAVLFFAAAFGIYKNIEMKKFVSNIRKASNIIIVSIIVLIFSVYHNGIALYKSIYSALLILIILFILIKSILKSLKIRSIRDNASYISLLFLFISAVTAGSLFLGGPFVIEQSADKKYFLTHLFNISYSFGIYDNHSGSPFNHNKSFLLFLKNFYLPVFLQCMVFCAFNFKKSFRSILKNKDKMFLIYFSCCSFLMFLLSMFVYDFYSGGIGYWLGQWLKSRIIEPYFYAVIFLDICILYTALKNTIAEKIMTCLLSADVLYCLLSVQFGAVWHVLIGISTLLYLPLHL